MKYIACILEESYFSSSKMDIRIFMCLFMMTYNVKRNNIECTPQHTVSLLKFPKKRVLQ